MGKGSTEGVSPQIQAGELANSSALTSIAQQSADNSQQLFGASFPGFQKAEDFYSTISSGDPYAIARADAPATQQIVQASDAAKANILRTGPAGGEKNLALEQVDVNKGSQIGQLGAGTYLSSFQSLAQLAGQGVGAATSANNTAIGAYGSANSGYGQIGQQQIQQQQLQQEQKGNTLGAFGSLVGAGAQLGVGALQFG